MKQLDLECRELVRIIMQKHKCLQPGLNFDVWDEEDAKEIVADLVEMLMGSEAIMIAFEKNHWEAKSNT